MILIGIKSKKNQKKSKKIQCFKQHLFFSKINPIFSSNEEEIKEQPPADEENTSVLSKLTRSPSDLHHITLNRPSGPGRAPSRCVH